MNEIVKQGNFLGYNYLIKHYDWTDNTKHGNIDYSILLSHIRTTDWYCGYVEIPKGHELYERDEMEIYHNEDLSVHGGLTFGGELDGVDGYYIGFDCHHLYDNSIEQDEYYTERQCKYLIDQLKEFRQ